MCILLAMKPSGQATASLVFGIIGLLSCFLVVPSLIAIGLGHQGLRETKNGAPNRSQAVAGTILGYLGAAPGIIFLVFLGIGALA
jgi:hypothetical protein